MNTTPAKVDHHSKHLTPRHHHKHNPIGRSGHNGKHGKPISILVPASDPKLTARQLQILCEIARKLDPKAIARKLRISYRTVEKHEQNLRKKFHVHNRIGLVNEAVRLGIIALVFT